MAENSADTMAAQAESRTTGQKVIFWLLWGILLVPPILLILGAGADLILYVPLLIQLTIHGMALKWFLDTMKPFSKSMLMLLGGTGLLYFLALGSCVVLLMSLSGANFH